MSSGRFTSGCNLIVIALVAATVWIFARQTAPQGRETFGEQQVRRMFDDRIFMSAHAVEGGNVRSLSSDDAIVRWAVSRYEPKPDGYRIFWSSDPPKTPPSFMGDHSSPTKTSLGFINIAKFFPDGSRKGQYLDFEHLWIVAAFELLNIEQTDEWRRLDQKVIKNEISKPEYIKEAARIEFHVLHKLIKFHQDVWIPWAKQAGFNTNPSDWRLDTPTNFDDWIKLYADNAGYPWVPFGDRFDFFKTENQCDPQRARIPEKNGKRETEEGGVGAQDAK